MTNHREKARGIINDWCCEYGNPYTITDVECRLIDKIEKAFEDTEREVKQEVLGDIKERIGDMVRHRVDSEEIIQYIYDSIEETLTDFDKFKEEQLNDGN